MFCKKESFLQFLLVLNVFTIFVAADEYRVELSCNGPEVIRGATIIFNAVLYEGDQLASGKYEYAWYYDARRSPTVFSSDQPVVHWHLNITKNSQLGPHVVHVTVKKTLFLIPYEIASDQLTFSVTDQLNGKLDLIQQNKTRDGKFISSADLVTTNITLTQSDSEFISNATSVITFWFIDCIYYGPTDNRQFSHFFPTSGQEYTIDALMIADFNPPPPPITTTTTTTTTTTPPTTTSTSRPSTSSTIAPNTTTLSTSGPAKFQTLSNNSINTKSFRKRNVELNGMGMNQTILMNINGTLVPYNDSFPYVCNGSVVQDAGKKYGYFSRRLIAKAPISSVNVTGNNWLQHGDILTLNVICDGSPSLRYCVRFKRGSYNATGNETCVAYLTLDTCSFLIQRYLGEDEEHTVIIVLENDVTKIVKSVAVTVYKVKKQAQLSVIVVPVACSLVAVVSIVFGIAYYIQNRRRFIVEVADFNFGVDYTDMEYKTFRERLQESFMNAFTRAPSPEPSEAPNWPPSQSQKYGSMT